MVRELLGLRATICFVRDVTRPTMNNSKGGKFAQSRRKVSFSQNKRNKNTLRHTPCDTAVYPGKGRNTIGQNCLRYTESWRIKGSDAAADRSSNADKTRVHAPFRAVFLPFRKSLRIAQLWRRGSFQCNNAKSKASNVTSVASVLRRHSQGSIKT